MIHKSKQSVGRVIIFLIIFFSIVFGICYYAFKHLPTQAIKYFVESLDLNASEIEDFKLSFSEIGLSNIRLSPKQKGACCEIKIHGLKIKSPSDVILGEEQIELSVNNVDLTLVKSTESTSSSDSKLPESFPLIYADIKNLNIISDQFPSSPLSFSGKIDSNSSRIKVRGDFKDTKDSKLSTQFELNAAGDIDLSIFESSIILDSISFKGIDGSLRLKLSDGIKTTKPGNFKVASLDGPIKFTDNTFDIDINKNSINLKNLSLHTFDGQIDIKNFPVSKLPGPVTIPVKLKNIDLQILLEFMEQEQIDATGKVSGDLPVLINGDEISIKNGQLWAEQPGGYIKYLGPENVLGENPQMLFAMSALKNLNYSTLKADVTYKPDGTLILGTSVEGENKEMNIKRPINVNLNVEQNVLKLLESLHAVDNFTKIKSNKK